MAEKLVPPIKTISSSSLMLEDDGAGFVRAVNFLGKEGVAALDEGGASLQADGDRLKRFAHKHQGEVGGSCVGKGSETGQSLDGAQVGRHAVFADFEL